MDDPGFIIDGQVYPVPSVFTFNMDELEILYNNCGLTIEDYADPNDPDEREQAERERSEKLRKPGFKRTLLHVAYARAHPEMSRSKIDQLIGKVDFMESMQQLLVDEPREDDAGPPSSGTTSVPKPSSSETPSPSNDTNDSSSESSGPSSSKSSAEPDALPENTTTSGSDTSATASPVRLAG